MRKSIFALSLLFFILMLMIVSSASIPRTLAQTNTTATPAPTVTVPGSTVDAFYVACADAGVVNLSGSLVSGWSVYFQLFAGADASGTALSTLRRAGVSGDFTFSERVAYPAGQTLSVGAVGSMRVVVARETDASRVDFDFTVNDNQDGCSTPQNPLGTSSETTGGADLGTTGSAPAANTVGVTTGILAPNGVLNPNLQPEATVVVGARPSDRFRSDTPGLIFAECNDFPLAEPGLVYDNDRVTIFWSWFTRTQEQMEQHLANAQYSVRMNTATFPNVQRSEITRRNGNYWVFFTADVGNLRPGHYEVEYRLTWANPVNDGYADFGPGTSTPIEAGNCNFNVLRNPQGSSVVYTDLFFPTNNPVHNILPNN